jgi:hypothetical protein
MHKALLASLITVLTLAGCNKNPASPAPSSATPLSAPSTSAADPVEARLRELAGNGAANCGHLNSQAADQTDAAAKCATQAAKEKHPFYVAYELPGMTVALAGNSEGKLFTLQSQAAVSGQPGAGLASGACPSELRIAPSGRVTCFAPGAFGMGMDATHGGATMPPAMGQNPHASTGSLPPGHPDPHKPQGANPPPKRP